MFDVCNVLFDELLVVGRCSLSVVCCMQFDARRSLFVVCLLCVICGCVWFAAC